MPLGEGYSAEEQLTGEAEWGGLQILVVPLKAEVWQAKRQAWDDEQRSRRDREALLAKEMAEMSPAMTAPAPKAARASVPIGLAPGGRMRQVIHPDRNRLEDWDVALAQRVFVTLTHAKDWKSITGEAAPHQPPTAKAYSQAGMPWFDHYGADQTALPGSEKLGALNSLAKLFKQVTGTALPDSSDIKTGTPTSIGPGAKSARPVRTAGSWDA